MHEETIQGFRLSPQQKRLWLLQGGAADAPLRASCVVRIDGPLDRAALAGAVARVVARHEMLRTGFRQIEGMTLPLQVIDGADGPLLREADLRCLAPTQQEARIAALLADPGPAARFVLAALADDRHALLIDLPALYADAAALGILACAIGAAYAGDATFDDPMQYADFSEWQNELIESPETEAGRDYWLRQDPATWRAPALPFERPADDRPFAPSVFAQAGRSSQREHARRERPIVVALAAPGGLPARIAARARAADAPEATFLLACWHALLWRMSGQSPVCVGVAYDGRKYEELEGLIGPLARHLPVAARSAPGMPFADLLRQVGEAVRAAGSWQEYFSWDLVRADAGAPPFLSLCFEYEAAPARIDAGGVSFTVTRRQVCIDRFALKLASARDGDALALAFHYDPLRFDEPAVVCLADQYLALVERAIDDPDAAIDALDLLSERERRRLLVELNATDADYPLDRPVHRMFEDQADRAPDAVALAYGARHLSYRALDARSNQLARRLRALGVGPDAPVAIGSARSIELVVGLLGILKAGGAYLPLDPAYPAERLRFMLEDSGARVLVTKDESAHSSLVTRHSSLVDLGAEWPAIAALPAGRLEIALDPANLAYLIYTSGSTGSPKGTMISHGALANYLNWATRAYAAGGRGALVHSPIGFDLTITSLFAPLASGGCAALAPETPGIDGLAGALRASSDLSLVKLTPAHLDLLAQALPPAAAAGATRALVIGGEALRYEQLAFWRRHAPATRLINEYGPTETVVGCCVYEVAPGDPRSGAVPIGRPIANTQIYLLGARMRPISVGAPGEIYIGGAQLARGYLGRPDLTAAAFVPNPFTLGSGVWGLGAGGKGQRADPEPQTRTPEPRLYRTGDLARFWPDGSIEYLGRIDTQVKLHGYRIELGEIAAALAQHPAVREAAALLREDAPGDPRLVAYVVTRDEVRATSDSTSSHADDLEDATKAESRKPNDDTDPSSFVLRPSSLGADSSLVTRHASLAADLRDWLGARLPAYMLPSAFVTLDTLPLTANGKLDRKALPPPDQAAAGQRAPFVAPRDATEARLAALWSEVLGVEQIGIDDNFFALGGDSFKAIRVVRRFDEALAAVELFQRPTIRELAERAARPAPPERAILYRLTAPIANPSLSLVCIPYGGGNAIAYQPLALALPGDYALYAVALPGHEFSRADEPFQPIDEFAGACADEIRRSVGGPIALYGQCVGVALTLEIAARLEAAGVELRAVYLGGALPPPRRRIPNPMRIALFNRLIPDKQVHSYLKSLGGFDGVIDPQELAVVMRSFRHDARGFTDYFAARAAAPAPRLRAPITCLIGDADPLTKGYQKRYAEWGAFAGQVRLAIIPGGGHYFVKHQAAEVARVIESEQRC